MAARAGWQWRVTPDPAAAYQPWPQGSAVAAQATREWKMWSEWPDADGLIAALERFDALFGSPAPN